MDEIIAIHPPRSYHGDDVVLWKGTHNGSFTISSAYNILSGDMQSKEHNFAKDLWATTCHSLWFWRNQRKHDDQFVMPSNLSFMLCNKFKVYHAAIDRGREISAKNQQEKHIKWNPPSFGCICVNVDGAVNGSLQASCGGLLRDHNGTWRRGFSKKHRQM
ncbi:uncharacterized protein LOC131623586 [Vicia villosa]|uniref:uncharacterized protein LOC131623586 n=1 Tax=Vicia villosa TaxID=3911 RepID=UPI00273AE02B|nr:uncharacterized protein LOC131623586 [Vicia villosa]